MEQMIRNNPANGNLLNKFRQEISDSCRQVMETNRDLYRLTVPTGAGKTLSSLRFALYHAKKDEKATHHIHSPIQLDSGTECGRNSKSSWRFFGSIGTPL